MFELQGHRGARGLKPENTLPSFEAAFDVGVSSVETDLHLSCDGLPILVHDPFLPVRNRPLVSSLSLQQIREYRADKNPDPRRFPHQDARATPLAELFAQERHQHIYAIPTLDDLFAFVHAYAGPLGTAAGKTKTQQAQASRIILDLELKRVPYRPEWIADDFAGPGAGRMEELVLAAIRTYGFLNRVRLRSFHHPCVKAVRRLAPKVSTAVLVGDTAPVAPSVLVRQAKAGYYCPSFEFLDKKQVEEVHDAGFKVLPWTVNEPADWGKLIAWQVDGITTDYPDRLAAFLKKRKVQIA